MKRIATTLTALLTMTVQAQDVHDWENPAVLGINKLPYHATLQLPSKWKECQEIMSLDGRWLFHWSRNPDERPAHFYREDYDVSQWDSTRLPFYDCHPMYSAIHDFGYPSPDVLKREAEKETEKPLMAREYAHAMGNSMGNFQEYWDVIYADSSIAGAAIWDWVDQGLNSSFFILHSSFLYGGDFGDQPNDGPFCINGLVAPDRTPHPTTTRCSTSISQYETEYIHPQDNGCRTDIRWFTIRRTGTPSLEGGSLSQLRITGCQPLCIRAWDYGEEDLEGARHPADVPRGRFVNLNIDLNVHGVGGIDTWGQRTLPQYTIDGNQPHHYAFIIEVQ